jgi:hypothetical protein
MEAKARGKEVMKYLVKKPSIRISPCYAHPDTKRKDIENHQSWKKNNNSSVNRTYRVCECQGICDDKCLGAEVFTDS